MNCLGVDASTSATGVVILNDDKIVFYGAETFKKCKSFWEKCDKIHEYFTILKKNHGYIDNFFIEEPMKKFSSGFSSATTISTLQRFNGIVCYIVRNIYNVEPTYINVATARQAAGVKTKSKKKTGKSVKEQVFEFFQKNDLSHIQWPTKKSGEFVDWSRDVTDAYVIAKGGLNTEPSDE